MAISSFSQFRMPIRLASRSLEVGVALGLLLSHLTLAQQITTAAGGNGEGSAPNQLNSPYGVCVDGAGNLYVTEQMNDRVQKFPPNSTSATAGVTVAGGNGRGSAPNQLAAPRGVFVDGAGNLYIADYSNDRVQKFPPNSTSATAGVTVAGGNGYGSAPNQFKRPSNVYVDESGNLYVADNFNFRVQKFPPNSTSATAGTTVAGSSGVDNDPNPFSLPSGVYVDGLGNLYVTDQGVYRVHRIPLNSTSATAGVTVAGGNGKGSAPNQLNSPNGFVVDESSNFYIGDSGNDRVQQFPPNSTSATAGVTVAGGNGRGSAPNQLNSPTDVAVDKAGNLYVADYGNNRVQKYSYPPVITRQPLSSTGVCPGATVTAQVSTTSVIAGPILTYQWYSTNGPLSGQTSPTLSLTNVQSSQAYYAVITSSNGLNTTSATFQLNVQAKPTVSVVASGSLSPANPTVTLTASGGGFYQFSPGATQLGNGPTATVSTPGIYSVFVTANTGCSNLASTTVVTAPAPDLSLQLFARPTGLYGPTPVTVVVDVVELNGLASSGLIILKITQDPKLSLSLPSNATTLDNRPVSNSVWQLSGPSNGYYTLTSSQAIAAGNKLSVGLTGSFSPGASSGLLTVSGTLVGGSGGEQNALNNTASNRLDYFQQ